VAFIATVPPARASGDTAVAYREARRMAGTPMVAKIVQLFSLRPDSMRFMIRGWELGMWAGDAPRPMRELIGAMVSRLNDCHY
jgi:hypothetical protein